MLVRCRDCRRCYLGARSIVEISISFAFLLLSSSNPVFSQSRADSADRVLDEIASFAERLCPTPVSTGFVKDGVFSVQGKVELSKLVKVAVDAGVTGAAKYSDEQYGGVLQKDLAELVKQSVDCRLKVFESLQGHLLGPNSGSTLVADVKHSPNVADALAPEAMAALGYAYLHGLNGLPRNEGNAVTWFMRAAQRGDSGAENNLGNMYEWGRGGLPQNDGEAVNWYRKAAEQGNSDAQNNLGVMYTTGLGGLTKDWDHAFELYAKSAATGNPFGECNLGTAYQFEKNETGYQYKPGKNENEALMLYRKAAEQNNGCGEGHLAAYYKHGQAGLTPDMSESLRWKALAESHGGTSSFKGLWALQWVP